MKNQVKYRILGHKTGKPYCFKRRIFKGFVIGLHGLISIWINKEGFLISISRPFTIFKYVEIEFGFSEFYFNVRINGFRKIRIPKWNYYD